MNFITRININKALAKVVQINGRKSMVKYVYLCFLWSVLNKWAHFVSFSHACYISTSNTFAHRLIESRIFSLKRTEPNLMLLIKEIRKLEYITITKINTHILTQRAFHMHYMKMVDRTGCHTICNTPCDLNLERPGAKNCRCRF